LVGQYDKNWSYLTVLETCTFAAKLYGIKSNSTEDIITAHVHDDLLDNHSNSKEDNTTAVVHDLIDKVGLTEVSNSRNLSLSGGQQRRLSLAIALLKQPKVLFLDEVTSGLDSASADRVCKVLRKLVDEKNVMVICTIHQPSTKIFLEYFDRFILLSKGCIAYDGGTKNAKDYFSRLGHPVPIMTNPSEHYLELVNSDFGDSEVVNKIINAWEKDGGFDEEWDGNDKEQVTQPSSFSKPSFFQETQILLQRHFKIVYRDPVLYLGRCIVALVMNCVFAFVYNNAKKNTQDQTMNKAWLCVWYMTIPVMFGTVAVYVLSDELKAIQSEQQNGMLRPLNYVMAKSILTLPFVFVYALFALGIPGLALQNYPTTSFVEVVVLWCTIIYLYEAFAECVAVWIRNKVVGILVYLSYWIGSFLFSGLFLPLDDLPTIFKLLYYGTPFSYYIRSGYYLLMKDATFEPCDRALTPFEPVCVDSSAGKDVVEALHNILPIFVNEDTMAKDICVLLLMAVLYKTLYILGIIVRGREISIPKS